MGVILLCVYTANGQALPSNINIPVWLMMIFSVVMVMGTTIRDKKIVKSVGVDIIEATEKAKGKIEVELDHAKE